jgi:hypothetical protein
MGSHSILTAGLWDAPRESEIGTKLPIADVCFHGEYLGVERTIRGRCGIDADDPSRT